MRKKLRRALPTGSRFIQPATPTTRPLLASAKRAASAPSGRRRTGLPFRASLPCEFSTAGRPGKHGVNRRKRSRTAHLPFCCKVSRDPPITSGLAPQASRKFWHCRCNRQICNGSSAKRQLLLSPLCEFSTSGKFDPLLELLRRPDRKDGPLVRTTCPDRTGLTDCPHKTASNASPTPVAQFLYARLLMNPNERSGGSRSTSVLAATTRSPGKEAFSPCPPC